MKNNGKSAADYAKMSLNYTPRKSGFNDEHIFNERVGVVIAQKGAVLVEDLQRPLLFHLQSQFSQPMGQAVFVDLLQHAAAEIAMQFEARLANDVASFHNVLHGSLLK